MHTNHQFPIPSPIADDSQFNIHHSYYSSDTAIGVKNVSKKYHLYESPYHRLKEALHPFRRQYHREFWALRDVSFDVKKGETVGIIGRNGCGKSTLLQIICSILQPTEGSVIVNGRVSALLELGSGFNPEFTGKQNVYMNGALLGLSKEEMDEQYNSIEQFADIGEFIDQPVKTYSSGMYVRLAFAVAINVEPNVLVVDEALAVGDMNFQAKCMTALTRMQKGGTTVLFVSHDMCAVKSLCSRGIYLEHGTVKAIGKSAEVAEMYIRSMREEMNAEQKKITRTSSSIESRDPLLKNEQLVQTGDVVFKRSEKFDRQVASFRYGSGGARITYVEMLNQDERPLSTIGFNQEVKINIYFESSLEKQVAVYFGIMDEKKNQITGAGLRQLDLPLIKTKNGEQFIVTYKIKLPLEEGNYSVMVQLSQPIIPDQTAEFIDVVDNAVVFTVERRTNARLWAKVHLFPTCEIVKLTNNAAENSAH